MYNYSNIIFNKVANYWFLLFISEQIDNKRNWPSIITYIHKHEQSPEELWPYL